MDIIKYGLIGAMIFVALTLAGRWQEFSTNQAEVIASTQANTIDSQALPAASGSTVQASDDFADMEQDIPQPEIAVANNKQGNTNSTALITVKTDTMIVKIDRKGGDIVHVALRKHLARLDENNTPFTLLDNSNRLTYVAQSGLIGRNGTDSGSKRPLFQSAKANYDLGDANELTVDLTFVDADNVQITKRYVFQKDSYLVAISNIVNNNSANEWQAAMFAQIKRDSSGDPGAESGGLGMQPFLGVATTNNEENYVKLNFEEMADDPYKAEITGGWISMVQHYFISAWIPPKDQPAAYSTKVTSSGANIIRYTGPALTVAPGDEGVLSANFYAGPKDQYKLEAISPHLDLTVDYGWLWWVAQPLFWLLTKLYAMLGNWGWAIVALTVVIKAVFFQLSAASYRSMAKMRTVAPKMQELKDRYGEDRQKLSQATMELYKKEKINPLGGCLPILIQMPVFIALYWVLMESVELRHAPFALWIEDLSAMDPYFVLPLIMGASMWAQQKLNPAPTDPMQAKMMQYLPVVFTFLFLWFPSGLVLYWVTNNLLSIAQQWVITRQIEAEAAKS
jgi:YidC/Oxa1 family membrane protein insertase